MGLPITYFAVRNLDSDIRFENPIQADANRRDTAVGNRIES